MGESLGLSGEKLAEYVTKQQSADRAERQAERGSAGHCLAEQWRHVTSNGQGHDYSISSLISR